jgi:hypothetical protein
MKSESNDGVSSSSLPHAFDNLINHPTQSSPVAKSLFIRSQPNIEEVVQSSSQIQDCIAQLAIQTIQ